MLKDREILIKNDLKSVTNQAATMYFESVTGKKELDMKKYQELKDKIASLRFDLVMVKQLIDDGHQ
jgi:hypothetical protein